MEMLMLGLHVINCSLAFKVVDFLFECCFAIVVGIHRSIDYEVVPQEVVYVLTYMYGYNLINCLAVKFSRPSLDLQSLLQPKHMKTDACCGSEWSCSLQAIFLA